MVIAEREVVFSPQRFEPSRAHIKRMLEIKVNRYKYIPYSEREWARNDIRRYAEENAPKLRRELRG